MADSPNTLTLNQDNFNSEVLESDTPVLVDFWAAWCGPCKAIAPTVDALADDFAGRAKVGKVDADKNPDLLAKYGVASIPTLVFFQNGEEVERIVGGTGKPVLAAKLSELAGAPA